MSGIRQLRFARPEGAAELLLVRHGESAVAVDGEPFPLVDGQGDPPLHKEGLRQAELVADRLQREEISAIYVSTLQRTAQTAAPLAARLGMTPVVEADIREVHLGEWEGGIFRKRVLEGHPIALKMRAEQRWDVIPGAETGDALRARIRRGIASIAERHPNETVAVFSHGAAIGEIIAIATGGRPFAFGGSDNAGISQLIVLGEQWMLRRFNDTAHLQLELSTRPQPLT
jgi:probable phosphoglycerate mutase